MGIANSLSTLAASIVAAIVFLVFAILSLFVTVFIVDVAAGIGGLEPDDSFVVLSAAIIAAAAIAAGGAGLTIEE